MLLSFCLELYLPPKSVLWAPSPQSILPCRYPKAGAAVWPVSKGVSFSHLRQLISSDPCIFTHSSLQVSELEQLFGLLKGDVESLFMTAPSVDLEALGSQLGEVHAQLGEQVGKLTFCTLSKILCTVTCCGPGTGQPAGEQVGFS